MSDKDDGFLKSIGTPGDSGDPQQPDPAAVKPYRADPRQFEGRTSADVERELDEKLVSDAHWKKTPSNDGNGLKYVDGKGNAIIVNRGYPDGLQNDMGDRLHQGPYIKIMPGSIRVPLAGNPALRGL